MADLQSLTVEQLRNKVYTLSRESKEWQDAVAEIGRRATPAPSPAEAHGDAVAVVEPVGGGNVEAMLLKALPVGTKLYAHPQPKGMQYALSVVTAQRDHAQAMLRELSKPKRTPVAKMLPIFVVGVPNVEWLTEEELPPGTLLYTNPDPAPAPTPEGWALAPDYRGFAHLGIGEYLLNHSAAGEPPEVIISIATEEEKVGRVIGEERPNPPGHVLQPDAMAVRLRFANPAGLEALEREIRKMRETHGWEVPCAAVAHEATLTIAAPNGEKIVAHGTSLDMMTLEKFVKSALSYVPVQGRQP